MCNECNWPFEEDEVKLVIGPPQIEICDKCGCFMPINGKCTVCKLADKKLTKK